MGAKRARVGAPCAETQSSPLAAAALHAAFHDAPPWLALDAGLPDLADLDDELDGLFDGAAGAAR
jgi:hypothetical protein